MRLIVRAGPAALRGGRANVRPPRRKVAGRQEIPLCSCARWARPSFAVDASRPRVSNDGMNDFPPQARAAFRVLHGLPGDPPPPVPAEARDAFAAWARRHRLTGLLQAGLGPAAGLEEAAFGKARRAALFAAEAARLSAGAPWLVLIKGPALAVQAWPDPALRSCDDLDFLCEHRHLPELLAHMQTAGYVPAARPPARLAHLWHFGWGLTFHHGTRGTAVEVNHRFCRPHVPWPCAASLRRPDLFAPVALDAAAVPAPVPALHLLLAAHHAAWHGWNRLAWAVDIAGLLRRHPDALPRAAELARACPYARRTLAVGIHAADALFGPGLLPTEGVPPPPPGLDQAVALFSGTARPLRGRDLRAAQQRLMSPRQRAASRLRRILTPGDGDFRRLALPRPLRFLYWVLRPVRRLFAG